MKKLIVLFLCVLGFATLKAAEPKQLEFVSFKEAAIDANNLIKQMIMDWPTAATNAKIKAALIRVSVENMPQTELEKISWGVPSHSYVNPDYSRLSDRQEIWLWVDPAKNVYLDATYNGTSDRKAINEVKANAIYDVKLRNNKTVSVGVNTIPAGAVIELENGIKATTPDQLNNVSLGKHVLKISLHGQHILTDTIVVTETNTKFPEGRPFYDLRQKKKISFKSKPSDAKIYREMADGNKEYLGTAPFTHELPYGSYTLLAESGADTEQLPITVNADSPAEYTLRPVKEIPYEAVAFYEGQRVAANLTVDGRSYGDEPRMAYQLRQKKGRYNLRMTYNGYSSSRNVAVNSAMSPVQEFRIYPKKERVMPWDKEFDSRLAGISFGIATKRYTNDESQLSTIKSLDLLGLRFGAHFEPVFTYWGLGLYTGVFYEYYFSSESSSYGDLENVTEQNIVIPIEAYYQLPLSKKFMISVHAGFGLDIVLSRGDSDEENGTTYEYWDDWGYYEESYGTSSVENPFDKKFDVNAQIGIDLKYSRVGLTVGFSRGLLGASSKFSAHSTKLNFALSYLF